MPKLTLVLSLATLVALVSGLHWPDAARLNLARLAHTRAVLTSGAAHGDLAHDARTTADAIAALTRAVDSDPYDVTSREFLADALFRAGDMDRAVEHWRVAGAGMMVRRRGAAALSAGDPVAAVAYFKAFTRVDAALPDGWLDLGQTYTDLAFFDAARASYEEVIRRWPRLAVGYARLADLLYFRMGRPGLATDVLDAAIAMAPGHEFYMVRSQIAAQQGRYSDAEADARQTLALEPTNGTYLLWLGDILHDQKRYDEALEQYDRAVGRSSNRGVEWLAPLRKGRTLTAAGRLDAAVEAYEAAVVPSVAQRVPPETLAEHYVLLGKACLRTDQTARARWAFTQALTHDPANTSAADHLKTLPAR